MAFKFLLHRLPVLLYCSLKGITMKGQRTCTIVLIMSISNSQHILCMSKNELVNSHKMLVCVKIHLLKYLIMKKVMNKLKYVCLLWTKKLGLASTWQFVWTKNIMIKILSTSIEIWPDGEGSHCHIVRYTSHPEGLVQLSVHRISV